MRVFLAIVTSCVAASFAVGVQARTPSQNDRNTCTWGSQVASQAQQSKLAGVTLYAARKKLQIKKFPKPWMRMTAFGITEQTYSSQSRLKPAAVGKTYFEQCMQHARQRK